MKFRSASFAASIAMSVLLAATGLAAESEAPADAPAKSAKAPKGEDTKSEDTKCETRTGSRIPPKKAVNCSSSHPWRSYSREEIDTTGYIDVAEALRHLDPIFY